MNSVSYISNTGAVTDFAFNKRTKRFEPIMWQVVFTSYIGHTKLLKAPNRFYSRKHAQEFGRAFTARYGSGLIRFKTVERLPQ